MKFSWVGWLLSKVHSELLQDCEANHWATEKGKQVCLEWSLWRSLSDIKEVANHITRASSARHRQVFKYLLWCFWHGLGMYLNARRASGFILPMTTEAPRRTLPYSWSWVSSSGASIENMVTLPAWESGLHLYEPQKLEVYFYSTGFEHEAMKMAWIYQRLQARSALPLGQGKCRCRRAESQGSLQLLASCMPYGRGIQHKSVTWPVAIQHHPHTHIEGWNHCFAEEWRGHGPHHEENARRWPEGQLFLQGCGRNPIVQG
jgi:hypothetical protein